MVVYIKTFDENMFKLKISGKYARKKVVRNAKKTPVQ